MFWWWTTSSIDPPTDFSINAYTPLLVGHSSPLDAHGKAQDTGGDAGMRFRRFLEPKYMRGFIWKTSESHISPSALSTQVEEPLPSPPSHDIHNKITSNTIRSHPDLFKIVTPIKVDVFERLLRSHPNRPFVKSICTGLREGFWPWADTKNEPTNITRDYHSKRRLKKEERDFLRAFCSEEQTKGRYSATFGPDLLPGMVSEPQFLVPKPGSDTFRPITHHSYGRFPLNDMIAKEDRSKKLDTLHDFCKALRHFHQKHGRGPRWIYKSDVSSAFRLLPMHFSWQIRQIITVQEGRKKLRMVDRCCCFGSGASPRIWCSFFGCVIWIAIFIRKITDIFHYMDDAFGIDDNPKLEFYKPYNDYYPRNQVRLLRLWDELGIPHDKKKQEFSRPSLTILGLQIDPQAMTITMPDSCRADLIAEIEAFIRSGRQLQLVDWQRLMGSIEWALNAYPLLRPVLNPLRNEISRNTHPQAVIPITKEVISSLKWLRGRLVNVPGVSILKAESWGRKDADVIVWCDACTGEGSGRPGLGFWCPAREVGFFGNGPTQKIFYLEALCVLSALHWAASLKPCPSRLLIFTDSLYTANMFHSMRAQPGYNEILMAAVEIMIDKKISLRVFHVAGTENTIADALSRSRFELVRQSQPRIKLERFQPPRLNTVRAGILDLINQQFAFCLGFLALCVCVLFVRW